MLLVILMLKKMLENNFMKNSLFHEIKFQKRKSNRV